MCVATCSPCRPPRLQQKLQQTGQKKLAPELSLLSALVVFMCPEGTLELVCGDGVEGVVLRISLVRYPAPLDETGVSLLYSPVHLELQKKIDACMRLFS